MCQQKRMCRYLVNAIMTERARQRGVLHLLHADNSHGRVAESAHIQRLLKLGMGGAFGPEPAPALFLEFVSELGEHGNVLVPAFALAVEDVWQEGNHAEGVAVAVGLQHLIAGDLNNL